MTTTPTDQSARDREAAWALAEMFAAFFDASDDDEFIVNASRDIATALTRAREEGVREGVERAAQMCDGLMKEYLDGLVAGDQYPMADDCAIALRALADSPAGREG